MMNRGNITINGKCYSFRQCRTDAGPDYCNLETSKCSFGTFSISGLTLFCKDFCVYPINWCTREPGYISQIHSSGEGYRYISELNVPDEKDRCTICARKIYDHQRFFKHVESGQKLMAFSPYLQQSELLQLEKAGAFLPWTRIGAKYEIFDRNIYFGKRFANSGYQVLTIWLPRRRPILKDVFAHTQIDGET